MVLELLESMGVDGEERDLFDPAIEEELFGKMKELELDFGQSLILLAGLEEEVKTIGNRLLFNDLGALLGYNLGESHLFEKYLIN